MKRQGIFTICSLRSKKHYLYKISVVFRININILYINQIKTFCYSSDPSKYFYDGNGKACEEERQVSKSRIEIAEERTVISVI